MSAPLGGGGKNTGEALEVTHTVLDTCHVPGPHSFAYIISSSLNSEVDVVYLHFTDGHFETMRG